MLPAFDPSVHVFHRAQVGASTPLPQPPPGCSLQQVWRVLDAEGLRELGPVHNRTAFLEDRGHDWKLTSTGGLRYSTRQAEVGEWLDVLLDYTLPHENVLRTPPPRFDPMTGVPIDQGDAPLHSSGPRRPAP